MVDAPQPPTFVDTALAVEKALRLDQDIKGVAGWPDIISEILSKIEACQVFVAHNSVVSADQRFRAPSWDQESVRDSIHEDSASAPIAAGQRPRPSFPHPQAEPDSQASPGMNRSESVLLWPNPCMAPKRDEVP